MASIPSVFDQYQKLNREHLTTVQPVCDESVREAPATATDFVLQMQQAPKTIFSRLQRAALSTGLDRTSGP
jgi:hypothetical protein